MLRYGTADTVYYFRNPLFFLQNTGDQLFWWKMCNVFLGTRVLTVEVITIGKQLLSAHFPRVVVFLALVPPVQAWLKFLKLEWMGLGVVLAAFG